MSESTLLTLPVVCTRGMIVFPGNRLSLDVGRPLSLKALELSSRDFDNNTYLYHKSILLLMIRNMMMFIMLELYVKLKRKSVAIVQGQSN